jgi:hypothetical protein
MGGGTAFLESLKVKRLAFHKDGKICRFRSLRYGKSTLKMLLHW